MDLNEINDEVKSAHMRYVTVLGDRLTAEANRKKTLELDKNSIASNKDEKGKSPSEAACDRVAKGTPEYIAAVEKEITAITRQETALMELQYARRKFEIGKLSV